MSCVQLRRVECELAHVPKAAVHRVGAAIFAIDLDLVNLRGISTRMATQAGRRHTGRRHTEGVHTQGAYAHAGHTRRMQHTQGVYTQVVHTGRKHTG